MNETNASHIKGESEIIMGIVKKVAVGIFFVVLLFQSVGTIGAGQRGVHTRFGGVTGKVMQEGLYFKIPFIEGVISMNVRIQKEEVESPSASKDLQEISLAIALNYHLKADKVAEVYQSVGKNYKSVLIIPAIEESVKASTAQFTAEELITKRQEVGNKIRLLLVERLESRGISVDEFSIVDLSFSVAFNKAIEAKVTAEQNALTAQNKLEQVKFEAEQKVVKAQAEAESIRIQAQAIQSQGGKDYVQLKAIEAWNGSLPVNWYGGSVLPFIGVK